MEDILSRDEKMATIYMTNFTEIIMYPLLVQKCINLVRKNIEEDGLKKARIEHLKA